MVKGWSSGIAVHRWSGFTLTASASNLNGQSGRCDRQYIYLAAFLRDSVCLRLRWFALAAVGNRSHIRKVAAVGCLCHADRPATVDLLRIVMMSFCLPGADRGWAGQG